MACNIVERWTRNPAPVTVEVKMVEEQITIKAEGYNDQNACQNEVVVCDDKRWVYGKLCVKTDGSLFVNQGGPEEPDSGFQDCKHIAVTTRRLVTDLPIAIRYISIVSRGQTLLLSGPIAW